MQKNAKNTLLSEDQKKFDQFETSLRSEAKNEIILQIFAARTRKINIVLCAIIAILVILLLPPIRANFSQQLSLALLYSLVLTFFIVALSGLPWHLAKLPRVKETAFFKIAVSIKMNALAKQQLHEIPAKEFSAIKEIDSINKDMADFELQCEEDLQKQEVLIDELTELQENIKIYLGKKT